MPRSRQRRVSLPSDRFGFLRSLRLLRDEVPSFDDYPFSIPAVRTLDEIEFHRSVTYFVGENGSGKSTLVEAIAMLAGFNPEGGSKNFSFSHQRTESELEEYLRLVRSPVRERDGFFLRAESFFNAASYLDSLDPPVLRSYGGRSLHAQSHGESFLSLAQHRFGKDSLFLLDEPEAALSPARQLTFLAIMHQRVLQGCQFVIASHSPIILSYPDAVIYQLDTEGIRSVAYADTEQYQITHDFMIDHERFLRILLAPEEDESQGDE